MGATNTSASTGTEKPTQDKIPDQKTVDEAGEVQIKDQDGKEIAFKSLYTDRPENETRQLIVFVRHFYCGLCEEYIRALAKSLPPSTLSQTSTTLTIIGCGEPVCIPDYKRRTNCPFEIYADPKCLLYKKLGMIVNLRGPPQNPEYFSRSFFRIAVSSFKNAVTSGSKMVKGGPSSQNGGEWLFQAGEIKWCHRMRNTGDHAEVKELKEVLGISEEFAG